MQRFLLVTASGLGVYLALVAAGRFLKRRTGLRLGVSYRLMACLTAISVFLGLLPGLEVTLPWLDAGIVLLGVVFVETVLRKWMWETSSGHSQGARVPRFFADLTGLALFLVAAFFVLTVIFDVRVPGLLAGSGIVAIVLGLAMQETLSNIVAGLALAFEKPFKSGDWLIVDNRHAEVIEVNWRATRLRATDNAYFDIPNSQLTRQTVVNLSHPDRVHAMRIAVNVEHTAPPNHVKDVLLHATVQVPGVLPSPPPKVFLSNFGECGLTYDIKFWLEDQGLYHDICDGIRSNIWYEFERDGIQLAFPMRRVHLSNADPTVTRAPAMTSTWLRRHPIFQCLSEEEAMGLLSEAHEQRFGRGERIVEQSKPGESMYLMIAGEASVVVDKEDEHTAVGGLRAGDCFGEMSLLSGKPRNATVITKTDCVVLEITKPSLTPILKQNRELDRNLSELLAKRRLETEGRMSQNHTGKTDAERHQAYVEHFLAGIRSFFKL